MKTAKAKKKTTAKKKAKRKAGVSPSQDKRMPNEGIAKMAQQSITYPAMWAAVQRIAQPVSFESLKQFYNI